MTWQPGQSGNPLGRPKDRPLTDALRMELTNPTDFKVHKRSARSIARAILAKAAAGDSAAFNIVADRLEGKVPQAIGQSPDLEPLQLIVTGVPRALEDKAAQAIDVTPADNAELSELPVAEPSVAEQSDHGLSEPSVAGLEDPM